MKVRDATKKKLVAFGRASILVLGLAGGARDLLAQVGTSAVLGYVYDKTGAAVAGATVTLTNPATGFERAKQSDSTGFYKFPDLLPGSYLLIVTQPAFKTYRAENLVLRVDQQLAHNATLELGAVTQEITVTGGAQLLETTSATTGQVITGTVITALPLNGRNFLQLASLGTGATPTVLQGSASSFATSLTARPASTVHLGDNREAATDYLLDGITARNDRAGNITFQISVDEIEEFKTQRTFFPAEYGFHPGIVNVATKGGTNDLHGDAWEFIRNDNLDARNFFGKSVEPFHQNQFGFTAGGPIRKNKLLAFGDYEGFRQILSSTATALYPTTKQFSGDLSGAGVFGNNPIFDPNSFDPVTGTRQPFAGNIVPSGRINSFSPKAVQTLFPQVATPPTGKGPNLLGNGFQTQRDNQFTVRLDAPDVKTFGRHTQLFGRFSFVNSLVFSRGLAPLTGLQRFQNARNTVFQANTSLSPSTVNVFRAGYMRDFSPFAWEGARGSVNISKELGLKNTTSENIDFAGPNFGLVGFSGTGGGFNLQTVTNRYIVADNITHIIGSHTIKAGGEIRFVRVMEETSTFANGQVTFTGQYTAQTRRNPTTGAIEIVPGTGSSVADFLLGLPTSGIAAFGSTLNHFRWREQALFVQDDWKVRPNFTIQAGLRWEPFSVPESEERRTYIFDFATGTLRFPLLGDAPPGAFTKPYKEFGPRIGFAYTPSFDKKSVWRGGFGIYFDTTQTNELQFESFGPPFFNLQSFAVPVSQPVPTFVLGQNVFPDIPPVAPVKGFVPPLGTGPFSTENVMKTPTVYQWSLNYERSLGKDWVVEIGYVGLTGKHLSRRYDADQCSIPDSLKCDLTRRPFPKLSEIFLTTNGAKSNAHMLNLRLEHRFANGVSLLVGYRWAKSLDTDSGANFASPTQRSACLNCDYGPSDFDIRQRFSSSAIWELPVGRGKRFLSNPSWVANAVLGGWEASAITTFQTGPWGNIFAPNLTGDSGINAHRGDCDIVSHNARYASGDVRSNGLQYLNPANFRVPTAGFFGNCGRGVYSGPGLNNWDVGLMKDFRVSERVAAEFRSEFFNAFNHAQFDLPVNNPASPLFGKILSAERPRVIQFGLKLSF